MLKAMQNLKMRWLKVARSHPTSLVT